MVSFLLTLKCHYLIGNRFSLVLILVVSTPPFHCLVILYWPSASDQVYSSVSKSLQILETKAVGDNRRKCVLNPYQVPVLSRLSEQIR